jgi:hypothetical protein
MTMKEMNHRLIRVLPALAIVFLASGRIQGPPAMELHAASLTPSLGLPTNASATGEARIVLSDRIDPVCGSTCSQRMTMNSVDIGDGIAVGQFDLFSEEGGGIRLHGSMTCLRVDGNVAQVGGVVTQSDIQELIGLQVTWLVVDNGEGKGAPADQTSDLFGNRDCESDITSHPRFVLFDAIQGNIQVRD